jgi:dihydrolipoamide dehydrogenase
MKTLDTDVAIIGAGTAGLAARRAALAHTSRVVVIEPGPHGTTCARVGCMPSKLLIAAAEAAHSAHDAGAFGVRVAGIEIDGEAVMDRVRRERDRFVGFVTESVAAWPEGQLVDGHARFVAPGELEVAGPVPMRLRAGRIVIATGSRPRVPPSWREALGDRLIVNDDVFGWTTLPRAVAVLGAGVIGLELAQALHRLGVRVRVFARGGRLGPLTDPALQAETRRVLAAELDVCLDADALALRRDGDTVGVRVGGGPEERFEWAIAASGRLPNVAGLGLEHAAIERDAHGVPRHDRRTMRCGESAVFLAGDASDDTLLLHEAADDGRIAGDNAGRYPDVRVRPRRAGLAVVFTDPQMVVAGASHAALCRQDVDFATGAVSFEDQGRSRVMRRNQGRLHVYGERGTGRLLGAEMLGPSAEHLGHLLAWSVQRGDTVQQMLDAPFYHPVVEEGLRTALRELQSTLAMGPLPVEHCLDCGPGA